MPYPQPVVIDSSVTASFVEDVMEAITRQYREESKGLKHDKDLMLRQKYGLVPPQFSGQETVLIRKGN